MTLNERLSSERLAVEAVRYKWALEELRFSPELEHVREVIKVADRNNLNIETVLAIVTGESSWNERASNYNTGSNDYGLFQLNNTWHNQYRSNINRHIRAGIEHYKWCLDTENNNERKALIRYNTGHGDNAHGSRYANYILGIKRQIETKARQFKVRGL